MKFLLHFFIWLLFFLVAFVFNKIPEGHIIAAGDFYQFINPNKNLSKYLFAWSDNFQGSYTNGIIVFPYIYFLSILIWIGFSYAQIYSILLFLLILLPFYSFYFATKLLNIKTQKYLRVMLALVYSLNTFNLNIVNFSWSITPHLLIYIFFPLLISLFYSLLKKYQNFKLAFFTLLFCFSLPSYGNIAFYLGLIFVQSLVFLVFIFLTNFSLIYEKIEILFKKNNNQITLIKENKTNVHKNDNKKQLLTNFLVHLIVQTIQFIIISPIFLLNYLSSQEVGDTLSKTKVFNGNTIENFVIPTSSSILNSLRLISHNMIFPHHSLAYNEFKYFSLVFPFIGIILISIFLLKKPEYKKNQLFFVCAPVFVLLTILTVRLAYPYTDFNYFFYSKTKWVFRSADKIFAFYPFFLIILILLALNHLKLKFYYKLFFILFLLAPAWYFVSGAIGGILSNVGTQNGIDYFSLTPKIPQEYYDANEKIQQLENNKNTTTTIISLPYSANVSINWSEYSKWNFMGNDVLRQVFDKSYIIANSFDHYTENVMTFKNLQKPNLKINEEDLLQAITKFSGEYVIFHKDIPNKNLIASLPIRLKLNKLIIEKKLELIQTNNYFELYQVAKKYQKPLINIEQNDYSLFSKQFTFQKINPTKYVFSGRIYSGDKMLLNQSFSKEWKTFLQSKNIPKCEKIKDYNYQNNLYLECQNQDQILNFTDFKYLFEKPVFDTNREMANDYANSWIIDTNYIKQNFSSEFYQENSDGSLDVNLVIFFRPQIFTYLLIFTSFLGISISTIYLIWWYFYRFKKLN